MDFQAWKKDKIRRAKAQLEISLATAIADNKENVSINTLTTKRGLRTTSIPYWMWGETVTKDE